RVDEHRLREIHLARERLEPRLVELASVREDRQLVPGQRRVCKDVADGEAEGGHAASLDTSTPTALESLFRAQIPPVFRPRTKKGVGLARTAESGGAHRAPCARPDEAPVGLS